MKPTGIKEGDKFEVIEKNGGIFLSPVVVYPKNEMVRIAKPVKKTQAQYRNGELQVYDDIDQMFEEMGIHLDET